MNSKIILFAIMIITGLLFSSCSKDEDESVSKPVINLTELGMENSKTALIGGELHIEANIEAEGKISKITIEIHPEGEHHSKNGEWEIDTSYTEFSGLLNTTFHKHIDVPMNADTGHYHFHFLVTDREGQQSAVQDEIRVLVADTTKQSIERTIFADIKQQHD
ncbi:MAG: DUF4625 domain-containing protein [Bacteroidales bacterium]|nr:DUF4625 domain-containing protein [Bacteroidales bacterium]